MMFCLLLFCFGKVYDIEDNYGICYGDVELLEVFLIDMICYGISNDWFDFDNLLV